MQQEAPSRPPSSEAMTDVLDALTGEPSRQECFHTLISFLPTRLL